MNHTSIYLNANETLISEISGGSEARVFLLQNTQGEKYVRKIWHQDYVSLKWKEQDTGVMSSPLRKALLQIDYLTNLPQQASTLFPKVLKHEISKRNNSIIGVLCDLEYIKGISISEFILKYNPSSETISKLYQAIFVLLSQKIHSHNLNIVTSETVDNAHLSKIKKRLHLITNKNQSIFRQLTQKPNIYINGISYQNIYPLLNLIQHHPLKHLLEPTYHSLVLGDTNTENIIITHPELLLEYMQKKSTSLNYESLGLKFVDPRSIGFNSEGKDTLDDYMYDNKPFHNSLGNYDMIHKEHFDIVINEYKNSPSIEIAFHKESPYYTSYANIHNYFRKITTIWQQTKQQSIPDYNDRYWLVRYIFLMGSHFAAMPPFHYTTKDDNNYLHQKRAIAVYCEGIKWLNLTYKILENQVSEYLDVPVTLK